MRNGILILIILLCFPRLVLSANLPHTLVTESEFWPSGFYTLQSLTVSGGAELHLQAPITLSFPAGAEVQVEGQITVVGGRAVFTNAQMGYSWLGVTLKGKENSLSNIQISRSMQGLRIEAAKADIEHITLSENVSNEVHAASNAHNLNLSDISIGNRNALQPAHYSGIFIESTSVDTFVAVQGLSFVGYENPIENSGVKIVGPYDVLQTVGLSSRNKCGTEIRLADRSSGGEISFRAGSCQSAPQPPVLLLPGLGTSLHPGMLSSAEKVTLKDGWFYIPQLVPGHVSLLSMLRQKFPAEICFYDWRRLPTDGPTEALAECVRSLSERFNSSQVDIVAHSYGGIVARSYIQTDDYHGSIRELFTLGTPSLGAAKAVNIWQQGVLPPDWQILKPLLSYYGYQNDTNALESIHLAFPSIAALQPIYIPYSEAENPFLALLRKEQGIFMGRVSLTELASGTEDTLFDSSKLIFEKGDGTVLLTSAEANNATSVSVQGNHGSLLNSALPYFAGRYGLDLNSVVRQDWNRDGASLQFFYFDCPVSVSITSPDGLPISTALGPPVFDDQTPSFLSSGEVTSGLRFIAIPYVQGVYTISVKAMANTHVRAWLDAGETEKEKREWDQLAGSTIKYQVVVGEEATTKEDSSKIANQFPNQNGGASPGPTGGGSIHNNTHVPRNTVTVSGSELKMAPQQTAKDVQKRQEAVILARQSWAYLRVYFLIPLIGCIILFLLLVILLRKSYRVRVRSQ